VDAARKKRMTKANSIIVIYDFAFDQPGAEFTEAAHREGEKIKRKALVKFVGSFPFSRDA
jgi:hypothetical protein